MEDWKARLTTLTGVNIFSLPIGLVIGVIGIDEKGIFIKNPMNVIQMPDQRLQGLMPLPGKPVKAYLFSPPEMVWDVTKKETLDNYTKYSTGITVTNKMPGGLPH